ncbi:hypothetical protein LshimejAT787_1500580 [Lyophyllum shimeji]|uniref:Uncharacterized protein n=1 Tax=Lyophyllum shimeji TaxID=47721 RepID=A0A9P3PYL4_LYOSH|nr:hypothetical protein LshimejAT787_1500580 [Lyophyllum shimeji]
MPELEAVCVCACGDIEGALWIVDEERARERQKDGGKVVPGERGDETMAVAEPVQEKKNQAGSGGRGVSPTSSPRFTYGASSSNNTRSTHRLSHSSPSSSHVFRPSLPPLPIPPVLEFERFNSNSSVGMGDSGSTSSTGKRGASPTELLKEGKQGEVLLSKRPSIKWKVQTPSPGLDVQNAMSGDPLHARSLGTPSLQLMTVPSSAMPSCKDVWLRPPPQLTPYR